MILIIPAALFVLCLYSVCFFSINISFSPKTAGVGKISLLTSSIAGICLCVLSCAFFYVFLLWSDTDQVEFSVITDSFSTFLITEAVYIGVGLAVTLGAVLLKSKLSAVVPVVLMLWSLINLFWTLGWSVWSEFEKFNGEPFVLLFGIGATMLLAAAAYVQTLNREKLLLDREKREELINRKNEKKLERERKRTQRKRIAEKKRKLKHPKGRN